MRLFFTCLVVLSASCGSPAFASYRSGNFETSQSACICHFGTAVISVTKLSLVAARAAIAPDIVRFPRTAIIPPWVVSNQNAPLNGFASSREPTHLVAGSG